MNIASIDIGTNTVLMLIANINKPSKTITPLVNKYRMPRIGKGLETGFPISKDRIEALYEVLEEYSGLIREYNCHKVISIGTSALRMASNAEDIVKEIKYRFGIEVRIVSGKEEAEISYLGSISGRSSPESSGDFLVIDIGGGSTEIIFGNKTSIKYSKSFSAGVVNLTEKIIKHDPPEETELATLDKEVGRLFKELTGLFPDDKTVIAVAGTPTSLSCIKQGLTDYDEKKIEGSRLKLKDFNSFIPMLSLKNHSEIIDAFQKIVNGREDIILTGTVLLYKLMKILNAEEVIVSGRGIRYGSIIKYLEE